jgi:chromosome segregation ATPase
MPEGSIRRLVIVVLAIVVMTGFLVDSAAQKRRRSRRRAPSAPKITNPEIYQPSPVDNANTDSADTAVTGNSNSNSNAARSEDPEAMKKTIRGLSNQVDKLNDKLNEMQASQQSMVDLERLSRAEQRSSQLRTELREVQGKKADLEAHLEMVENDLKPENIERSVAGYGTTRPEELRAQRQKQLENDRGRTRQQIDQLTASESRIQQAIATSDVEIDRLQKKLEAGDKAAIENAKTGAQTNVAQPSPTPTP